MKWHLRIIRELISLLELAIAEIREHNADDYYRTNEAILQRWDEFILKVEGEL